VIAAVSGADPAYAADLVAQRLEGQPLRIESLAGYRHRSFSDGRALFR